MVMLVAGDMLMWMHGQLISSQFSPEDIYIYIYTLAHKKKNPEDIPRDVPCMLALMLMNSC